MSALRKYYAGISDTLLGRLYAQAILDIRHEEMRKEDEEGNRYQGKRIRDLPIHLSRELATRLQAIAGTQKEVESVFYGFDDTGTTAAEGRKQRTYVSGARAMSMSRAREALSVMEWMAFLIDSDNLRIESACWTVRLDAIDAVRPIIKEARRRKTAFNRQRLPKELACFRAHLEHGVEVENRESLEKLAWFIESDRTRLESALRKLGRSVGDLERAVGLALGTNLSH